MKTDPLLDGYLEDPDARRTRQTVVEVSREDCAAALADTESFLQPLPGVPGQWVEPWPVRRYRGAVGEVPSTVLEEGEGYLVTGAVGRRLPAGICWLAATPGAVRGAEEPERCRAVGATVVRDHADGALLAHQIRLAWTDDGPPAPIQDAVKLALGNGMQRRLDRWAARARD